MTESVQNKEVELLEVIGVEDKLPLKKSNSFKCPTFICNVWIISLSTNSFKY